MWLASIGMLREMYGAAELTNSPLPLSCRMLFLMVMFSPFSIHTAAALFT